MRKVLLGLFIATILIADEAGTHLGGESTPEARRDTQIGRSESQKERAIKAIEEAFLLRSERAQEHYDFIRSRVTQEDEKGAVGDLVALSFALSDEQRAAALERIKGELSQLKSEDDPLTYRVLERAKWVLEELLGVRGGAGAIELAVKKEVKDARQANASRVQKFQEELDQALNGSEEAKKSILSQYTPEALLDYLSARKEDDIGAKMAKVLGWQDKDGATHLDITIPKSVAGEVEPQTWTLGKTNDEIKASLKNFDSHQLGHEVSTDGQIRRAKLNQDPARLAERKFVRSSPRSGALERHDPVIAGPEDRKRYCDRDNPGFLASSEADHRPYYFFRPFAEADRVGYASFINGEHQNFIKDLKTGKEKRVPGPWDPVPTLDERYLTLPSYGGRNGIKIYAMEDLLQDNPDPKPIYEEDEKKDPASGGTVTQVRNHDILNGVYQSIGIISKDDFATTYRIISDKDGISFQDYKIYHGRRRDQRVEPQLKKPLRLCSSMAEERFSLPMLSKDGRFISFFDNQDQSTKIYSIGQDGNGCEEVANLGMGTSKADFNYDPENPMVVFHKYSYEPPKDDYIKVPSDDLVGNVYTYNLKTKELKRLTNNSNANSIYPNFKKDGTVMYIHHPHGATDDEGGEKSRFVKVDPLKSPGLNIDTFGDANPGRQRALTAIGGLLNEICSPHSGAFTAESARTGILSLTREDCDKMVRENWEKFRDKVGAVSGIKDSLGDVTKLDKQQLLEACGVTAPATLDGRGTTSGGFRPPTSDIPGLCVRCHSQDIPWDDRDALRAFRTRSGVPLVDDILERINAPKFLADGTRNPRHMPREGELSALDKEKLIRWAAAMR